jgi:hypothetical protein
MLPAWHTNHYLVKSFMRHCTSAVLKEAAPDANPSAGNARTTECRHRKQSLPMAAHFDETSLVSQLKVEG